MCLYSRQYALLVTILCVAVFQSFSDICKISLFIKQNKTRDLQNNHTNTIHFGFILSNSVKNVIQQIPMKIIIQSQDLS